MRPRWRRKWQHDLVTGDWSPVPTRIVSNEEYVPLAQTAEQARVAALLAGAAERHARVLAMTRREFLASGSGMAAAFLAMNQVFGPFFDVSPVEAIEVAAAAERQPVGQFVFDIQTHHVAAPRRFPELLGLRRTGRAWNPALARDRGTMDDLYLENFIKEVFLDSDTTVALISGLPSATDERNILPPRKMVETRQIVNRLAASPRMLSHGLVAPNKGAADLEAMHRQASELKIDAWKGYTGLPLGSPPRGWWVDDEKVAYPMLETARKLGIRNVCLHKGLPLGSGSDEHWRPRDLEKAAQDFPDLNFIVYHSAFRSVARALDAARDEFRHSARVEWVSELCDIRRRHPGLRNLYAELGSTFGMLVITAPLLCAHVLGMLIQSLGADHVLWGTDSIWWGSPRWQIDAFRRFKMPESLMARFGYAALSPEVKAKILGLNAAKVFGVDPAAHRNPVPRDYVSRLRAAYLEEGPVPSLAQYGWVLDGA